MKRTEEINILFTIDENYIFPMIVAMLSIRSNQKQGHYTFAIIATRITLDKIKEQIGSLKIWDENISFKVVVVDEEVFNDAKVFSTHISKTAFFRLLACELLPEWNKCLYLDPDILVLGDLMELYSYDIENFYLGAICEFVDKYRFNHFWSLKSELVDKPGDYFNSGILLMNLRKMRADGLSSIFLSHLTNEYKSEDQDILNVCCKDSIRYLPLKYNLPYRYLKRASMIYNRCICEEEIQEADENPCIIHFLGANGKPWLVSWIKAADLWWKFADEISNNSMYLLTRKNCVEQEKKWQWNYFKEIVKKRKWIIWGYTDYSRKLFDNLEGIAEVVGFCDSNPGKQKEQYKGKRIASPDELRTKDEYGIIIANQSAKRGIRENLKNKGFKDENIIDYYYKSRIFYLALRKEFYEKELQEILYKEKCDDMIGLSYNAMIEYLNANRKREWINTMIRDYWLDEWLLYSKI